MQEDSENESVAPEIFKPRPWLLRTFVIGMSTGFLLGIIGTVGLGISMAVYGSQSIESVFTGEKFQNYLPAIGLVGPLFALFAVLLVGVTKLLERIRPADDY